jgi:hypothetical protein
MSLSFELLAQVDARFKAEQEAQLREGDSMPWSTAAKYQADLKAMEVRNKTLEANALKRGDAVVAK